MEYILTPFMFEMPGGAKTTLKITKDVVVESLKDKHYGTDEGKK